MTFPWNKTNFPPTLRSMVGGLLVHAANLSGCTKTSYSSFAVVVNSISSLSVVVCTVLGLGAFTGAGVGGFETEGVALTELAGVEFNEGLYTSFPCVAINSPANLDKAFRSCGTRFSRIKERSTLFEAVSENMSTSN